MRKDIFHYAYIYKILIGGSSIFTNIKLKDGIDTQYFELVVKNAIIGPKLDMQDLNQDIFLKTTRLKGKRQLCSIIDIQKSRGSRKSI